MRRALPAAVLLTLSAGTAAAGCSSSAPTANNAAASTSPSPSPSDTGAPTATATAPVTGSQCSVADHGLASGHTAWATLMRTGSTFTDWESATANYLSTTRGAADFDTTAAGADAQDTLDAQALASALAQLDTDLQQGVATGTAPASYPDDAKAATAAASLFDGCAA